MVKSRKLRFARNTRSILECSGQRRHLASLAVRQEALEREMRRVIGHLQTLK